jgi:RHS repeat-associated protein
VNQYNWNENDLLGQISGGVTASFNYDMFGRRRDSTLNGHLMQTAWIDNELNLMVPDGDWSQRIRVFSPCPESGVDELTYRRIGDDASRDRYVLRDANNNVIALTDGNQQSQTQYSYEPYGATSQTGLVDPNSQQFTERENDGTGLYYYRSRYYSPATGRFISEDPIGYASGQTNAYVYVGGNPVQFADPFREAGITFGHGARHLAGTGLSTRCVEDAISAQVQPMLPQTSIGAGFWGTVVVDGVRIQYRGMPINGGVNIGTYFPW